MRLAAIGLLAKTLRVQRAKRQLDAGDHTMTDIAFEAGFGSLRRFNAAFAELYGRSPSSLRAVRELRAYSVQKNPGLRSSP